MLANFNALCYTYGSIVARYYSPDMKRFINADIVAGEISNAITLNRFAYANGNPAMFVDPLGLSVWSWIKDKAGKATKWVKETILEPIKKDILPQVKKRAKIGFKVLETGALYLDSKYPSTPDFDNTDHNSANDIRDELIHDQTKEKVAKLKLGAASMSDVGCEVIAVYNAKILLGDENVSLADMIQTFEDQKAITMATILKGKFGSNPFALNRVFHAEGLKSTKIHGFKEMTNTPGVYVVSFWNDSSFDSQVHTVAVKVINETNKIVYNHYSNDNNVWSYETYSEHLFITGYRVSME